MDTNNWRPVQGCNPPAAPSPAAGVDWRVHLRHDDRTRMVNKILETLRDHLPHAAGLSELQRIAVRFEERIYTTATSQPDYLGKISWKMRQLEMGQAFGNAQVIPNQNIPGQGSRS